MHTPVSKSPCKGRFEKEGLKFLTSRSDQKLEVYKETIFRGTSFLWTRGVKASAAEYEPPSPPAAEQVSVAACRSRRWTRTG